MAKKAKGKKASNEDIRKEGLQPSAEAPAAEPDVSDAEPEEEAAPSPEDFDPAASHTGSNTHLRRMMDSNFIEYASYVIKDRAIPDVDDGLKPVQRRILWSLHRMDDGKFHKVANVIGHTMQYHPHGDASIGDALVVLANKEYFIEKQGNFGNIFTGDEASAARYIECRLSNLARETLFNSDITVFTDSYDGRNKEPVRLPAKIPALLMMGADGIAVGMSTHILPHNFKELLEAQMAILKDEPFQLYPDFLQGGIMDVSKYEDGNGKVVVRARIDVDGRRLVIREIPALTTTDKLIASIEKAANRNKIKVSAINDYTAENVEIEIVPQRGYDPQKALQALYAYTDCSMSITTNLMVICDNKPVQMTVPQVIRRNTDKLLEHLRRELEIEIGKHLDKLLSRTLAQIFVEEGVYKRIEKCKTYELIVKEVRNGLEKHRAEWEPIIKQLLECSERRGVPEDDKPLQARLQEMRDGIVPESEIERLLEIPIRRISLFDINRNREEMEVLKAQLDEAHKNLKRLKPYAIRKIKELLDKYGEGRERRTRIEADGFQKIDKSSVALNNIRVGWDRKNCYVGTSVKSDDIVLCNEFDHLLCIERKGSYKVINIPEKIFIDRLYEFRKYDKSTEFGVVYSDPKTGKCYCKRCNIGSFITDKEYRICPEGCRLELITPRPRAIYECQIDTPIKARKTQELNLAETPLRSAKASGVMLSQRKLLKIAFVRYLDEELSAPAQPSNASVQQDAPPPQKDSPAPRDSQKTKELHPAIIADDDSSSSEPRESKKTRKPKGKSSGQPPKKSSDSSSNESDDDYENWGISQPELGF